MGISPTYSYIFPTVGCFWVLGLWYAVRRDFLSRRHRRSVTLQRSRGDIGALASREGWQNHFWGCGGILKKFRGRWVGMHLLSSKAVPASATGQRALGEANATDDTAVVPPGGTCSVRSVGKSPSSRWPKARSLARTSLSLPPILVRRRGVLHALASENSQAFSIRDRRRGFRGRCGGPRS